jgi:lipopolysaccharide export system permease protein
MLNIRQLTQQKDSLDQRLKKDQSNFARQLLSQRFFNKENRSYRTDSVKREKVLAKTLDADSLFQSLPLFEKMNTVNTALNYARKTKENITRKRNNFSAQQKWIRKYVNEWHRKFTLSFACFIFFFIGAPLGAIIRKGGLGMPVIVSVLFFITYYIISMTGERFAKEGVLPPYQGMWISSLVILPLGIILTYKATTDSAILNAEAYLDFFKKINIFKKKKNA